MVTLRDSVRWINKSPETVLIGGVDKIALVGSVQPHFLLGTRDNLERIKKGLIKIDQYIALLINESELEYLDYNLLSIKTAVVGENLSHIEHQDIVRIEPITNKARVLFKKSFRHNSLFITEQCNNYCVMCSQPPRKVDDSWLLDEMFKIIDLIPKDAYAISITGGEPTLAGDRLFGIIKYLKNKLPYTSVHVLSNGRKFSDRDFAKACADIGHPDLMFGIPLYSDNYIDHDYVVQAKNGFREAINGIINLKKHGVKVEIRCVIHRDTFNRLPELAHYITRNLTYIDQVVLMGYEAMGFGKTNAKQLFILPELFIDKLNTGIRILKNAKIKVSVYNLPLCQLNGDAASHAVRSISDWKNEYLPECSSCVDKPNCTGFFASTKALYVGIAKPRILSV